MFQNKKRNKKTNRKKAYLWGQGAEWFCMVILWLKGYQILAHRFKCKVGEIDIIVQKNGVICFVEVKARKKTEDALYAISSHQRQRIAKAADWYLAKNRYGQTDIFCRFDVMAVEPWTIPTHVKDAWQMDMTY